MDRPSHRSGQPVLVAVCPSCALAYTAAAPGHCPYCGPAATWCGRLTPLPGIRPTTIAIGNPGAPFAGVMLERNKP